MSTHTIGVLIRLSAVAHTACTWKLHRSVREMSSCNRKRAKKGKVFAAGEVVMVVLDTGSLGTVDRAGTEGWRVVGLPLWKEGVRSGCTFAVRRAVIQLW